MKKNLLFVLAAVLLTAMIFSTATADGPNTPCVCEDRADVDVEPGDGEGPDGICDSCDHQIPGDIYQPGDGDRDGDGIPDGDPDAPPPCEEDPE